MKFGLTIVTISLLLAACFFSEDGPATAQWTRGECLLDGPPLKVVASLDEETLTGTIEETNGGFILTVNKASSHCGGDFSFPYEVKGNNLYIRYETGDVLTGCVCEYDYSFEFSFSPDDIEEIYYIDKLVRIVDP